MTGAVAANVFESSSDPSSVADIVQVQSGSAAVSDASSILVTLPTATTRGDLLAVYSRWDSSVTATISDDNGNSWSDAGNGVAQLTNGGGSQVFYAADIASGTTSVTVRFSGPSAATLYVHEYSGVSSTDPVDRADAGAGTGSRLASRSIGTSQPGDLLFGAGSGDGVIANPGNGYTVEAMHAGDIVEDRTAGDAGRYRATAWMRDDGDWVMNVVAFKAAASEQPPTDTPSPSTPSTDDPTPSTSPTSPTSEPSSTSTTSTTTPPPSSSSSSSPTSSPTSPTSPSRPASSAPSTSAPGGHCSGAGNDADGADPWGGCWPGPRTTGVPAGTALTVVDGDQTYSTAGEVISGKDIRGCVKVTAPNVTIKNSRISCSGSAVDYTGTSNDGRMTLQDVTISSNRTVGSSCVGERYVTVIRANISGCENGFDADHDVTVLDSYIHDLTQISDGGDPHTDGVQSYGASNLDFQHTVWYADTPPNEMDDKGTSAMILNNNGAGGTSADTLIKRNLLAGGAYTLYCPPSTSNFNVVENVFSHKFEPSPDFPRGNVGAYGPTSGCDRSQTSFSGNVYDTGGSVTASS